MASSPKAPNPYETAQAQSNSNMQAAGYNAAIGNADQYNPYGSVTNTITGQQPIYGQGGKIVGYAPKYSQTTKLSPDQERLLAWETATKYNIGKSATAQSQAVGEKLSTPYSTAGLSPWQTYGKAEAQRKESGPTDRQAIEDAIMSRYNRDAGSAQRSEDARLAAQGMSVGTPGYGRVGEGRDRARTDASKQAYLASGDESRQATAAWNAATQQDYLNSTDWTNNMNNLRGNQANEQMTERNQMINELMAMLTGSQTNVPQGAGWNAPSTSAPNVADMIYQNYNQRSQQAAGTNAAIAGIAGNVVGAFNPLSRMFPGAGAVAR